MYLTLEVVGAQSGSLGADRRRIVGTGGLTIGRDETSEWMIPEPYISRQHARITFTNGRFFVEGLGRNPIALTNPNNTLPNNRPFEVKSGDHLLIDQYDILVTVHPGEAPGTRPLVIPDDPFGLMPDAAPAPSLPAARARSAIPEMWSDGSASHIETVELDPLVALGVSVDVQASAPGPRVNLQSDSPLRDPYSPPPARMPPALEPVPRDPARIPDRWDQSAVEGASALLAADRGRGGGVPVDWDHPPAPPPRAAPVRAPPAPRPQPNAVIPPAAPLPRPTVQSALSVPPTPVAATPTVAMAMPSGLAGAEMAAGLRELLLGAGLTELSPEAMRELGQVLRIVVQGVMQVLQARSEIKAQFRLPLTRVQARENNPLKFSPDVESVLNTLLVRRNAAYLATVPAFEEAFADIRNHQMALLEGIRVAFDSMLKRLDPAELQKQFDASAKGTGGLFGRNALGAKSRYWDQYREYFERLGTDADDTFRRLFGDVFAQAYERQLNRLKHTAGGRDAEGQGE